MSYRRLRRHILHNNNLRRPNGRHFPDDIFKWIFLNENVWISINISLKFVPRGPINNIPLLVHVMAWRRPGDKPLSEPMMVRYPTHICVPRPQLVKIPDEIYWYRSTLEMLISEYVNGFNTILRIKLPFIHSILSPDIRWGCASSIAF